MASGGVEGTHSVLSRRRRRLGRRRGVEAAAQVGEVSWRRGDGGRVVHCWSRGRFWTSGRLYFTGGSRGGTREGLAAETSYGGEGIGLL